MQESGKYAHHAVDINVGELRCHGFPACQAFPADTPQCSEHLRLQLTVMFAHNNTILWTALSATVDCKSTHSRFEHQGPHFSSHKQKVFKGRLTELQRTCTVASRSPCPCRLLGLWARLTDSSYRSF